MVCVSDYIHALSGSESKLVNFPLSHSGSEDASEPEKDASGFRVVSKPLVLRKSYRLDYYTV